MGILEYATIQIWLWCIPGLPCFAIDDLGKTPHMPGEKCYVKVVKCDDPGNPFVPCWEPDPLPVPCDIRRECGNR